MTINWRALAQQAMHKSVDIRAKERLGTSSPICIYSLCERLNINVRFVDVSMEGLYVRDDPPIILLSAFRPLPRRNFTCAHEVGHHVFGHSSYLDEVLEDTGKKATKPDEFLVNTFAGFLLMPILAVKKAFAQRKWEVSTATPEQIFVVACSFGVGYETLIGHLAYSLKIITPQKAESLAKIKLKQIRSSILGFSFDGPIIAADKYWSLPTLDAEVQTLLLLPHKTEASNDVITPQTDHPQGRIFLANRPGTVDICGEDGWQVRVQVSKREFEGLIKFRFLEQI